MAQKINRLNAIKVKKLNKAGKYADGAGLYLQVAKSGSKSWILRYMRNRKEREMGLGSETSVPLAEARKLAANYRQMLAQGLDPIEERKAKIKESAISAAKQITFKECAESYIAAHEKSWKHPKHKQQWVNSLENYAYPVLGSLPVQDIDTALVVKVLEGIWTTKTETASRVRCRTETILDWATAREFRSGENPARWRGHLDKLFPARSKIAKTQHMKALPYKKLGKFVEELQEQSGVAPKALEFTILTATRTNETLGAKWSEIDFDEKTWTIPAERMKAGRTHRVPLSRRAIKILKEMQALYDSEFIFPGNSRSETLSDMSMLMVIRRMGYDITTHGFRSTFRDWASECTNFPERVAEASLAHLVQNKTEAAYARSDLFDKRRKLMDAWASFCGEIWAKPSKVVQMRRA